MLKVGMIGAGWHALSDHAPALRQCSDSEDFRGRVELTAVCDLDIEKAGVAAEQFGFKHVYDSIGTMLPSVDAVLSIISPAAQRAALIPIVDQRKPVLVEKPLGQNLGEAEQIAALLAEHPHMISLNRRFDPGVTLARQWISQQSPPRKISGAMLRKDRREPDFIWSTGIHLCDLVCFLAGPAKIDRVKIDPASGLLAERVHIFGDDWSITLDTGTHQRWRVMCWKNDRLEFEQVADPTTPSFERNGTVAETKAFLNAILENKSMSPTAADALPGTRLTVGCAHETKR